MPWDKTLGEIIKVARKRKAWSQEELGKKVSCSFGVISTYETGKAEPPEAVKDKLAKLLNIPREQLTPAPCTTDVHHFVHHPGAQSEKPRGNVKFVETPSNIFGILHGAPVLGTVGATANGVRGKAMLQEIPADVRYFRVEVLDTSMEPLARPGQFLLVDATEPPRNGDLVVVDLSKSEEEEEWVFKRYEIDSGRRTLKSIDPTASAISLDQQPRRWFRVRGIDFA
jgi:transcriptional regulator with XRE-family HTH domain